MDFKYINEPEDRYELAVLDANYKKGDLEFRMDSARGRPVTHVIDSDPSSSKHELKVYRGRRYEATSKRGAKFVEGHRSLSPATAERFMDRGTLLAVPKGKLDWEDYEQSLAGVESPNIGTYEDFADYLREFGKEKPWPSHLKWPRQTTIRKWLREATFNPEDERKRFVLRWRDAVYEEADIEARKRLENWFHKEWRPTREEIRDIDTDGLYDDSDNDADYVDDEQDSDGSNSDDDDDYGSKDLDKYETHQAHRFRGARAQFGPSKPGPHRKTQKGGIRHRTPKNQLRDKPLLNRDSQAHHLRPRGCPVAYMQGRRQNNYPTQHRRPSVTPVSLQFLAFHFARSYNPPGRSQVVRVFLIETTFLFGLRLGTNPYKEAQ
ncbi:hypothetical protein SCARD494_07162 [Seiridium cardinale]